MKGLLCHDCQHFHQHYIKDEECCASVRCGHCTYPRLKSRKPDTPACTHFAQRQPPATASWKSDVTHYLNSPLVRYILSLKSPPESENDRNE